MSPDAEYGYERAHEPHVHASVWPKVLELAPLLTGGTKVLKVGCGTGFHSAWLANRGRTVGIDMSGAGIAIARDTYPSVRFEALRADVMSADRLAAAA